MYSAGLSGIFFLRNKLRPAMPNAPSEQVTTEPRCPTSPGSAPGAHARRAIEAVTDGHRAAAQWRRPVAPLGRSGSEWVTEAQTTHFGVWNVRKWSEGRTIHATPH